MTEGNEGRGQRTARAVLAALGALVVLGMAVRLLAIAIQGGGTDYIPWALKNYFGGITPAYLKLADALLDFRYAIDQTALGYPPGYPAVLAAFKLLGLEDLQSMRVAQAAIDCAGVPLSYYLLRRANLHLALALCGAALYAVYPLWAFGSIFLLAEFASPVLMLGALALTVHCGDRERPATALLAATGAFLGVAALIRPDLLLLPGMLGAWLVWRHTNRRGLAAAVVLLAGFAVPMSGWGLHNRLVHGHWIFSTTGGGNALWEGLGALPNPYGFVLDDRKAGEVLQSKGMKWLSVEADRYFRSEYFRAWREHPEFVLSVIKWRWTNLLTDSEKWLPEAESTYRLKRFLDLGGVLLVLAAAIAFRRSPVRLLIAVVPVVYALGSIGMTHWEARYVRYVHLSYLFALLMLLELAVVQARRLSRRAGLAALALPCAATAWAAGDVVASARYEADGVRSIALAGAAEKKGTLAPGVDLCRLDFQPAVEAARISRRGCDLDLDTSPEPYFYQAVATVPVPEGSAVILRYAGRIEAGGLAVGLLTGDGARFIAQASHPATGEFEGRLAGYAGRRDAVRVVVSNFHPGGGASRATLSRVEVQCHPVACTAGTPGRQPGQNANSTAPQGAR